MRNPRPLKKIVIPLDKAFKFILIIWRNVDTLRLANSQHGVDYSALFEENAEGDCVGTMHIEKFTSHDIIAHELKHVIDYYIYRSTTETTARMMQECINTIDAVMENL